MRSRSRARLSVDQRRAQLLDLGRRLFNARPYDAISIDEIAAAAGISKGLLYHYFPSKRHFYVEVVRIGAEHVQRVTAVRPELAPADQLRQSIDSFLTYVEKNASAYGHLLRSGVGTDPEASAIVETTRRAMVDQVVRSIGLGEGRPAVRLVIRGWIGFSEGVTLDWADRRDVPRRDVLRLLIAAFENTLTVAAAADPRSAPILTQVLATLRAPRVLQRAGNRAQRAAITPRTPASRRNSRRQSAP
jgi:AcrR family transcriptional regulator